MSTTTATASRPSVSLLSILPLVASALPGEWTVKTRMTQHTETPEPNYGELIRADGLKLYAVSNAYGNKGKIRFAHSRVTGKDGRYVEVYGAPVPNNYGGSDTPKLPNPAINCTETKSAEQMAADIARRLIPEAETCDKLAREKIAQHEAHENEELANLRRVSAAAGLADIPHVRGEVSREVPLNPNPRGGWNYSRGYGDAIVSASSVDFKLSSIPTDKAVALVEWLRANVFTS